MPSPFALLVLTAPEPLPPRYTRRGRVIRWFLWSGRAVAVALASLLAWTLRAVGVSVVIVAALCVLALVLAAVAIVLPVGLVAVLCRGGAARCDFRARVAAGTVLEN